MTSSLLSMLICIIFLSLPIKSTYTSASHGKSTEMQKRFTYKGSVHKAVCNSLRGRGCREFPSLADPMETLHRLCEPQLGACYALFSSHIDSMAADEDLVLNRRNINPSDLAFKHLGFNWALLWPLAAGFIWSIFGKLPSETSVTVKPDSEIFQGRIPLQ